MSHIFYAKKVDRPPTLLLAPVVLQSMSRGGCLHKWGRGDLFCRVVRSSGQLPLCNTAATGAEPRRATSASIYLYKQVIFFHQNKFTLQKEGLLRQDLGC